MQLKVTKIRKIRKFSEDFKKSLVSSYEKGEYSVCQLSKLYKVAATQIYEWIYKFSTFNKKGYRIIEMKSSNENKLKELTNQVKELEQIIGQKQILIDYLEKMIELAKEDLGVDLKKNISTSLSNGSKKTKKK
jgi:transposase